MKKLLKKLKDEKTQNQIIKLLYAVIVCTALLLVVEVIFQLPAVNNMFSTDVLESNKGNNTLVWVSLWLLMYAQVTIIPVPAMPIYIACNKAGLIAPGPELVDLFSTETGFFVFFVMTACLAGAITAYLLGRLGGRRAVKWIAGDEEEYNEWTRKLNCKAGKYFYAATIVLPLFPDDILCLVAGALKFDFKFYVLVHIFGRLIGTVCFLAFIRLPYINQFFQGTTEGIPWAMIVYGLLFLTSLTLVIIHKFKNKNK